MNALATLSIAADLVSWNEQEFSLQVFDRTQRQVAINDVVMIEGDGNYAHFYLRNGKKLMVSRTLKEYETLLDAYNFVRIHKSYLINLHHLKEYDTQCEEMAVLKNGLRVEVARRRKKEFQLKAESFLKRGSR